MTLNHTESPYKAAFPYLAILSQDINHLQAFETYNMKNVIPFLGKIEILPSPTELFSF